MVNRGATMLMTTSVIAFSLSATIAQYCIKNGMSSTLVVVYRFVTPLLILTPLFLLHVIKTGAPNPNTTNFIRAGTLLASQELLMFSMYHLPAAVAIALYFSAPIFIGLIEKNICFSKLVKMLLAMVGIFLATGASFCVKSLLYLFSAIGSGVLFAVTQVSLKSLVNKQEKITVLFYTYLICGLVSIAINYETPSNLVVVKDVKFSFMVMFVGVFSLLNQTLRSSAYRRVDGVTSLSNLLFLSVPFSIMLNLFFFGSSVTPVMLLGLALLSPILIKANT